MRQKRYATAYDRSDMLRLRLGSEKAFVIRPTSAVAAISYLDIQ